MCPSSEGVPPFIPPATRDAMERERLSEPADAAIASAPAEQPVTERRATPAVRALDKHSEFCQCETCRPLPTEPSARIAELQAKLDDKSLPQFPNYRPSWRAEIRRLREQLAAPAEQPAAPVEDK